MRYKIFYVTALSLSLGYLATQTMQTPPSTPSSSRQPSPTHQKVPYNESATPASETTTLETVELFIKRIETTALHTKESFEEFKSLCARAYKIIEKRLSAQELWIEFPKKIFAFVQKLNVTPHDLIFIFGDIHGDSATLLNAIEKLVETGVLNEQWELEEHNHLIFLGDYTDRGHDGVEVWYSLLKLLEANPDPSDVIILRGNHESFDMNVSAGIAPGTHGYIDELRQKFALPPYEHDPDNYIFCTEQLYNHLPSALYITTQNTRIICAHGGLELGFNPHPLLSAQEQVLFMPIQELNRASETAKFSPELKTSLETNLGASVLQDFVPQKISELHFLWSDFSDTPKTTLSGRGAGWNLGSDLTQALLERDHIRCMIRGHQHTLAYETVLSRNKGFYSFEKNPIHTIISFSKIQDFPILCEHYSFIKLEVGETFDSWKAWHMRDEEKLEIRLLPSTIGRAPSPTPRLKRSEPEPQTADQMTIEDLRAPEEDLSTFSENLARPTTPPSPLFGQSIKRIRK